MRAECGVWGSRGLMDDMADASSKQRAIRAAPAPRGTGRARRRFGIDRDETWASPLPDGGGGFLVPSESSGEAVWSSMGLPLFASLDLDQTQCQLHDRNE